MEKYSDMVERLGTPAGWAVAYPVLVEAGAAALPAVMLGLKHWNAKVRKWCAGFLDHFGDQACVPAMVRAVRDESADVRRHALHALGCQACKKEPLEVDAVGILLGLAMRDKNMRVRTAAVHMLGNQMPDGRVVSALSRAVERERNEKWVRVARWTLEKHSCVDR